MQQITHLVNVYEQDVKKSSGTVKSECLSEKDAGFCSGEETDLDTDYHSPTDSSRDSVDVKNYSEHLIYCRKRKCVEERRLIADGPQAKLIKTENRRTENAAFVSNETFKASGNYDSVREDSSDMKWSSPFRPWNADELSLNSGNVQEEPLSLVVVKEKPDDCEEQSSEGSARHSPVTVSLKTQNSPVDQQSQEIVRISNNCRIAIKHESTSGYTSSSSTLSLEEKGKSSHCRSSHRNYKNMTRERRMEANARERTRVHTISAAFDSLRKCIPAYASNQKLSKLSVLRIACSYIVTLSRIAGNDYTVDQSQPGLSDCIENVSSTIQMEGKTRKKKDS